MNTENKTRLSVKKGAKLPKLTIQQQIDNQQVIERMNRKITFTKNPRHLNSSIPYSIAINNQSEQTSLNNSITLLGQQHTLAQNKAVFTANPSHLVFSSYQVNHIYEAQIQFINHSQHTQRVKIAPLSKKEFVIASVKYPKENSGDIAPGLHVSIFVRFRPISLHDYDDQLIIIAGDGVMKIPIIAKRQKWIIEWPKAINAGHCWVGDVLKQNIPLKNVGGQTFFSIKNSSHQDHHEIGCFKISPSSFKIDKGKTAELQVIFSPLKQGKFKQLIKIESDQGQQQLIQIQIQGKSYKAHLQLNNINGQKVKQQRTHRNVFINNCQKGKVTKASVQIKNLAVVGVDYFWNSQLSQSNCLKILKPQGKIEAAANQIFQFQYLPKTREPQNIQLTLYLCNLPQQSLGSNSVVKDLIINGKKRQGIEALVFHVKTSPKQSDMKITPLHQQIYNKIYQNIVKTSKVTLFNNSQTSREFKIIKIKDSQYHTCQTNINQGVIQGNSSIEIELFFKIHQLNKQMCRSYFLVEFDNALSQIFSIQGQVTYPTIQLSKNQIFYGLCRTYTAIKNKIVFTNNDETQNWIRFNNPYKYYELDFYDLYQFQDQQYFMKRLQIISQIPENQQQDKKGWIIVPPKKSFSVQFILHTMQEQHIQLQVIVQVKNGRSIPIKIEAQTQQVSMVLSNNKINLKEIYKGNTYNSNKFLKKQLAVLNKGNIDAQFKITLPEDDLCSIKIDPLQGVVKAKSKKRLDLYLQPLKTGNLLSEIKIQFFDSQNIHGKQYSQNVQIIQQTLNKKKNLVGQSILNIQTTISGVQIKYYIKDQSRAKRVKQKITDDSNTSVKMSTISGKSNTKTYYQNQKVIYPDLQDIQFYNCQINQVRQLQIIIQNASGLTAQYQIQAQNFHTLEPPAQSTKRSNKGLIGQDQQAFNSQMGQTFIKNRLLDRSQKVHLSNNKGISFLCQPSSGILHKKQFNKIIITMFNDTSGRFKDNLLIKIKDHQIKKFPIDIHIKGTPVSLSRNQLGIDFNRDTPLMNLGTFLSFNGPSKRNIKLINNGPKPVQINWLLYPYNKIDQNRNLFEISFGQPVPGSGNLIQSKWAPIKPQVDNQSSFEVLPKNKILKGRQQATFTLTVKNLQKLGEISNLLIGQPFLIEQDKKTPMQSLGVVLQGQCVDPFLHIDRKHQNHINKFQRFAVEAQQNQTNAKNYHRKIKLKNHFRANVSFTLSVQTIKQKQSQKNYQSFKIVSTSTDSSIASLQQKQKLSMKTFVQKSFILPHQSFIQVGIDLVANSKDFNEWPLEKIIRKDGKLIVQFSNGSKQQINLVGWLYRPWIQIQMTNGLPYSSQNFQINFGTIHVKNSKKAQIFIANPSKSIAKWNIAYLKYHETMKFKFQQALWTDQDKQDQTIKDQKKCFRLSRDQGIILSQSIPIHYMPGTLALPSNDDNYASNHKPDKVQILFKPQQNFLYKSKFRISIQDGLYFDIIVKGRGTYQQQYEKK